MANPYQPPKTRAERKAAAREAAKLLMRESKNKPPRENYYFDLFLLSCSLFMEFLALRNGISWLAWIAMLLLWLSVLDYTKRRATKTRIICAVVSLVLLIGATELLLIDPVRGPFSYLSKPTHKDTFVFHAGIAVPMPIRNLRSGIDFSKNIMSMGDGNGQPIEMSVQKSWPFDWQIRVTLRGHTIYAPGVQTDGIIFQYDGKKITRISSGIEANYDSRALELIADGKPIFQVIVADDYDIYVNSVTRNNITVHSGGIEYPPGTLVTIMNEGRFIYNYPIQNLTDKDFPPRLFKYPAYSHIGERE